MIHKLWLIGSVKNSLILSSCFRVIFNENEISFSSFDSSWIVSQKILQRESEEIENNEAEDAEGLNEEIKKNDEVESVGNEEVTEEISGKPYSILFH